MMKAVNPKPSIVRPPLLRRLDYLPAGVAVVLGVTTGALLGICFALGLLPVAGMGFVLLLGSLLRTREPALCGPVQGQTRGQRQGRRVPLCARPAPLVLKFDLRLFDLD